MTVSAQIILAIATWCNGSYNNGRVMLVRECKSTIFMCVQKEKEIFLLEAALTDCISKSIKDWEMGKN